MVEPGENGGRSELRMLLNQAVAVEVVDPETLKFVDVNERACTDLGYSREEMLSLRVYDIDPIIDDARRITVKERLQQSQVLVLESIHRRKDGTTFPVEISLSQVRLERSYVVAIVRNITQREYAENIAESGNALDHSEWQRYYQAALLEGDRNKLFKLVEIAESAVVTRIEALPPETVDRHEKDELMDAWSVLQMIKKRKLNFFE